MSTMSQRGWSVLVISDSVQLSTACLRDFASDSDYMSSSEQLSMSMSKEMNVPENGFGWTPH